jgi:hypothetical protein
MCYAFCFGSSQNFYQLGLSAAAILISLLALWSSWRVWRKSNRPIVTAFVTELAGGNVSTVFNLVVANTGNRPATHVRLHATSVDIDQLVDPGAPKERRQDIANCFLQEAEIPLLRNSEELTTSFGAVKSPGAWLNYGAQIAIEITYRDLDGGTYISKLPLRIYARDGFGGGVWQRAATLGG